MARLTQPPPPEPEVQPELSHFELAESLLLEIDPDDVSGSDRVRNIALTALAHAVLALAVTTFSQERIIQDVVGALSVSHPRTHPPHEDD